MADLRVCFCLPRGHVRITGGGGGGCHMIGQAALACSCFAAGTEDQPAPWLGTACWSSLGLAEPAAGGAKEQALPSGLGRPDLPRPLTCTVRHSGDTRRCVGSPSIPLPFLPRALECGRSQEDAGTLTTHS